MRPIPTRRRSIATPRGSERHCARSLTGQVSPRVGGVAESWSRSRGPVADISFPPLCRLNTMPPPDRQLGGVLCKSLAPVERPIQGPLGTPAQAVERGPPGDPRDVISHGVKSD